MEEIYKTAIEHLSKVFGNLTKLVRGKETFYVDSERRPLFMYEQDEKNGTIFISHQRIWSFLKEVFGLNYKQIQGVVETWLEETYNIKGRTPEHLPHVFSYYFATPIQANLRSGFIS